MTGLGVAVSRPGDFRDVKKIADHLVRTHLNPRLREARKTRDNSPVTPGGVAIAAAAIKEGSWTEKDVKKHFDRMFDK